MKQGNPNIIRRIIRGLRCLFLLLLVIYGLLHTRPVQNEITRRLSAILSSEDLVIELIGLHGIFPFWLELEALHVSDAQGPWLELSDLQTKWIYQNHLIEIHSLQIQKGIWTRLPSTSENKNKNANTTVSLPVNIDLRQATLQQLILGPELAGQETEIRLELAGQLNKENSMLEAEGSISSKELTATGMLLLDLKEHSFNSSLEGTLFEGNSFTLSNQGNTLATELDWTLESADTKQFLEDSLNRAQPFFRSSETYSTYIPSFGKEAHVLTWKTSVKIREGVFRSENEVKIGAGSIRFPVVWTPESMALTTSIDVHDLESEKTKLTRFFVEIRHSPEEWKLLASEIDFSAGGLKLKLLEPLSIQGDSATFTVPETKFQLNGYPLKGRGSWSSQKLNFECILPDMRLGDLPQYEDLEVKGILNGSVFLEGTLEQPVLQSSLHLRNVEVTVEDVGAPNKMEGDLEGRWDQQALHIEGFLKDQSGNRIELTIDSSEKWSLLPLKFPTRSASFNSALKGKVELSIANNLPWFSEHRLSGSLQTNLVFSQEKGALDLKGSLELDRGQYESYQLGTKLSDIRVGVELQNNKIHLQTLSAKTPGNGTIKAEGTLSAFNLSSLEGELEVVFDDAQLLHLDPVKAALSGKVIVAKNELKPIALSGNLILEETVFYLDRLPPPIPKVLEYKIMGEPEIKESATPPNVSSKKPTITGNIHVDIPGRLSVQGKNILSSWEGSVDISLRNDGVYLSGKLNPRRGTVTFFGRAFRLNRGSVYFNDYLNLPPILDLEADYSRADLEAVLRVSGRADDPTFSLSSSPPLPEDEIIAYILFGKNLSTITGLQAVEVGMAVKSMMDSGGGKKWDVMGNARSFLGVDQLEFRESGDAGGSTEIVAGRQLNDYFYIEVSQNLKEPDSSIVLEYEIRKNFSITTETGTHTLPGIGVTWKRD